VLMFVLSCNPSSEAGGAGFAQGARMPTATYHEHARCGWPHAAVITPGGISGLAGGRRDPNVRYLCAGVAESEKH
jgi:hypothetical protein